MRMTILFLFITLSAFSGGKRYKITAESKELIKAYNAFALKSYKALNAEGNTIYSPYSLAVLLHMTSTGATDETLAEFQELLGLNEANSDGIKGLLKYIASRNKAGFESAQAIAVQKDWPIKKAFTTKLEQDFSSKIFSLDLRGDTEESVKIINAWIKEKTHGLLSNAIPEESIRQTTALILMNVSYFRGAWKTQFKVRNTRRKTFNLEDGRMVYTKTMHQDSPAGAYLFQDERMTALDLPFRKGMAMRFYLPKDMDTTMVSFEQSFKIKDLTEVKFHEKISKLSLPKFKLQKTIPLIKILKKLGLKKAFIQGEAQLGKISEMPNYIVEVFQKAGIIVNEQGAKAYSGSFGFDEDFSSEPMPFNLNRPFFFTIVDKPSGLILFMGKVMNPKKTH